MSKKEGPNCDWCIMRAFSLNPRPISKADYKVTVSQDSRMFAGQEINLCNYHKNGIALKFTKTEKL
jgi:hypothetical protein